MEGCSVIVLGIDPGVTGAVGAINTAGGGYRVRDIPTRDILGAGMVKRRVCGRGLLATLRELAPAGHAVLVVVERVHTMPGTRNSPQSQGSLMQSKGVIQGVLDCLGWRVEEVSPQTWQRHFGIGKGKADSVDVARRLFPDLAVDLKRAKDHNRCEALLMAQFGAGRWA